MKKYKCNVCGQIFESESMPEVCPICGAGRDAIEEVADSINFSRDTIEKFVIIGGGIAGLECAKAIRKRNNTAQITMICGEGIIPYNRPMLSKLLASGLPFDALAVETYDYYQKHNINLICDALASKIQTKEKIVELTDGRKLAYDKLCIATGANANNPIGNTDGSIPVKVLRTLRDALELESIGNGSKIFIVGGGILGIEAAAGLKKMGADVKVLERGDRIIKQQADEEASFRLADSLEKAGIGIRLNISVEKISRKTVFFTDGTEESADMILASAGVRSEISLAKEAGIATDRGIIVDRFMRTSVQDVFAAGDCAQLDGFLGGLWATSSPQGAIAGAVMAGDESAEYKQPVISTLFEEFGASMFICGRINGSNLRYEVESSAEAYSKLAYSGDKLTGFILFGDIRRAYDLRNIVAGKE